ncbi:uncharacterized protein [Nicotiana tomentosiformis]|uniref:uncharacterized protein n=1 Tax=Nicotiana tomentosiformis TaxID=4098 RepID=UPI00388CA1FE
MEVLSAYEGASGQLVNKSCPIFYSRRMMDYYQGLISKVLDKLQAWKGKLLSISGRSVLIAHVLQSMPIHLLSAMNPPKYVINKLHKIFEQFFRSSSIGGNNRHWASWNTLCMPCEEGGIDFRSLHDVSKALFYVPYWMLETRGYFSVKTAWDYLRRLGYFMPSKCWCCAQPKEKTLHHLFFTSVTASSVWKYFLLRALPSCIIWELWKRRNSMKYGEAVTTSRVIYQVSSTLQALIQELPGEGWIKVNTDGASRGNPKRSAIGYCVRNGIGDVCYAVGKQLNKATNTEAEAEDIVEALRFCRLQQYTKVWIQTDLMLLKNIIDGSWKPPWCIADQVEEIMHLLEGYINKVSHINRECNKLADHLANYALDFGDIECEEFWQMDIQGRRIVNEDKLQCPYLRVKVAKN